MNPEVTAAIIAPSVSFLTLIGTLAAQYFSRRATEQDTKEAFEAQRDQLDKTLAEQRRHLDRTLAEQRTRTLNERFATAAGQLGSDKPPAVRLAGVYAMAGLAEARHGARWRELTADEKAAAVTTLRELAAGRADLVAEIARVLEGFGEGELDEPLVGQAVGPMPEGRGRPGGDPGIDRGRPPPEGSHQDAAVLRRPARRALAEAVIRHDLGRVVAAPG